MYQHTVVLLIFVILSVCISLRLLIIIAVIHHIINWTHKKKKCKCY